MTAALPRTENSTAGLVMLEAARTVVVTGEEHHQDVLAQYAPPAGGPGRQVAVELGFAPIARGRHAGERGIVVLLGGRRIGELTVRMTQRYGPLVEQVLRGGGRPGCVARVVPGRRGIEVELRLPDVTEPAPAPSGGRAPRPIPPADSPRPGDRRIGRPWWIAGGVVALLLVIGVGVGGRAPSPPSAPVAAAGPAANVASTPITTPPVVADPTAATPPTSATRAPAGSPAATRPAPTPRPQPKTPPQTPKAAAKPSAKATKSAVASGCDPNYSGCVPIASDVDCSGGSGNGPKYVRGPVRVTGQDVYGLDNNNDGVACEA